jgi:TRAP-type mannitol/chloroaromatic compound transport system substrate-binding protein
VKSRKLALLLAATAIVALVAAGCAPSAAPTTTTPGATTPTPSATTPSAPAGETFDWKLQMFYPVADPASGAMIGVAENIKVATGGRLNIECFPVGAIVPAQKEIDSLNQGVFEATFVSHGWHTHLYKASFLFAQRAGGLTPIQAMTWLRLGGGMELAEEMYSTLTDVKYLATMLVHPPEVWCHSNKQLKSMADFQGLKIRSPGDSGAILSRMGASSVSLPGAEIYESAQRGVIDATEYITQATNWDMGFQEVFDYMYMSPTRAPSDSIGLFANKTAWNKLPADIQATVMAEVHAETLRWYAWSLQADNVALQKFKDYGTVVEVIPADIDAKLVEVAADYFAEMAAGDAMFAKVMESQDAWKAMCEAQGPWAD